MPGYGRILSLGRTEEASGRSTRRYQFIYNNGISSFSKVLDEHNLSHFLTDEIALRPEIVDSALKALSHGENCLLPEMELSENHALALGMGQVSSDY